MTNFEAISPVFLVPDVARTIGWYRDVLGCDVRSHPETEPFHWGMASKGGVQLMFQWAPQYENPDRQSYRPGGGVWDAYLWLSGIDELYAAINDRAHIIEPPYQQPYGRREFIIRDPNGYVL